jgi:hypothetical protein
MQMKGVQRKQTKSQTGKTFNQWKLHLSCFFNPIPYVCIVQINSKYETRATWQSTSILFVVPIHENSVYDSSLSGTPPAKS